MSQRLSGSTCGGVAARQGSISCDRNAGVAPGAEVGGCVWVCVCAYGGASVLIWYVPRMEVRVS